MSTNACTFCDAGLACATKKVTYAFLCSRCKRWLAYGVGGITIEIVNRSICKLPLARGYETGQVVPWGDASDLCIDCAMKESQEKREKLALHEARVLASRDLSEFS